MNDSDRSLRSLIVVEPYFASEHVGVRRVISNYWTRLLRLGFEVDLAIVVNGKLNRVSSNAAHATYSAISQEVTGDDEVTWSSEVRRRSARKSHWRAFPIKSMPNLEDSVESECDSGDYEVSLLSNAWMCSRRMPNMQFTHGVIYDLVPNLLAAQLLDFGVPLFGATSFANEHHRGYEYFLAHVKTLLCISESTMQDFVTYYQPPDSIDVVVDIPFDLDDFVRERGTSLVPKSDGSRSTVLLVNVLDPRKNLLQVTQALAAVAAKMAINVEIVGKERLDPTDDPRAYFRRMGEAGAQVRWHRQASDAKLRQLYRSSRVLLFPSLYEGLGLPLLESQALGTPAISGSNSSLGEINFNPNLLVDPRSTSEIERVVVSALSDHEGEIIRSDALVHETRTFLSSHRSFEASI